jgi:hypothetical protein
MCSRFLKGMALPWNLKRVALSGFFGWKFFR